MILTIAGKELRRLFTSPLAWVILAFLQLILAWIFLSRLQTFLELQPQIAHDARRTWIHRRSSWRPSSAPPRSCC